MTKHILFRAPEDSSLNHHGIKTLKQLTAKVMSIMCVSLFSDEIGRVDAENTYVGQRSCAAVAVPNSNKIRWSSPELFAPTTRYHTADIPPKALVWQPAISNHF